MITPLETDKMPRAVKLTSMKVIKKIFLFSGIALCFVVLLLSGIGFYLYYHPDQVKPMIERSLSASTGASCTIENLSYSFKPMVLEARGILFKPLKQQKTFSMEIPFIRADMDVEGAWGHRSLVLKNMQIKGLYLDIFSERFTFPGILPAKRGPSFPAGMARGLIGLFFFRDIKFQSGELLEGRISAAMGDQAFQALRIHAIANADKPLFLSFALEVKNSSRNMNFTASNVNILSSHTFDINDLKFSGTLESQDMRLQDSELNIQKMGVFSKFTYSHGPKNLVVENLNVRCQGIALRSDLKKTGSLPISVTAAESLSMETGLTYNMNQGKTALAPLKLHIGGLSVMGKTDTLLPPLDIDLKAEGISGNYPVIEVKDVAVQIPQAKISTRTRDTLIGDIRVHIPDGRIDAEKKSVILPEVRLETLGLKNLLLGIRLQERNLNLTVQGKETSLFHAAVTYHLIPSDWNIKVHDSIQINVTGPQTGPWQVKAKLSLDDLVFQNKDGSIMGENVSLGTEIEGVVDLKRSSMTFAADIDVQAGETLYDRYYLNLKRNPIVTSCNGTYDLQKRLIELSKLRFDLTGILPLEIRGIFKQGSSSKANADVTVILPKVPLKPIFHHFLQEPYKTEKPFLATLETEGDVSAQFRINGFQDAWQVRGRLGWLGGNFSLPEKGIALKGIHLDLPVWYRTGVAKPPVETLSGKLEVESITIPLLPKQPLSILLDTGPNRISVKSPTVIQVPGGDLRLGSVQVEKLFGPDLTIHTRMEFGEIKLQPLLSRIWTRPLKGSFTGILDPVRYENHTLTTLGELKAEVFQGNIILSDLGASGVFTSAPVFKLNVKWEDLLLSEMTTDTAFGTIEGVLKGRLRDVEMAYGQPQRFDLLLETVQKKGISQKISVKAVENIAQIGGGQSPFVGLAGAFASLFKKFPYEKIGIKANLENDVFTVNGTIREGGTEYLVKRGSFSGVDIVNQNPDNRISFKDMVKRIKRIGSKGGPVVK
ncbi:MAG: hypothetical protein OEV45_05875 [Desulfobacteraceae bacterium]|nr:hypothetical protein [Desulfobacteraceae bacterium]